MLGGSEFRLRRGFACGKTLARRKSAAGQKAGWVVFSDTFSRFQNSILTVPSTSPRRSYRSRRFLSQSYLSFILSRLLSKPQPLRWAPVWGRRCAAGFFRKRERESINLDRSLQNKRQLQTQLPFASGLAALGAAVYMAAAWGVMPGWTGCRWTAHGAAWRPSACSGP